MCNNGNNKKDSGPGYNAGLTLPFSHGKGHVLSLSLPSFQQSGRWIGFDHTEVHDSQRKEHRNCPLGHCKFSHNHTPANPWERPALFVLSSERLPVSWSVPPCFSRGAKASCSFLGIWNRQCTILCEHELLQATLWMENKKERLLCRDYGFEATLWILV